MATSNAEAPTEQTHTVSWRATKDMSVEDVMHAAEEARLAAVDKSSDEDCADMKPDPDTEGITQMLGLGASVGNEPVFWVKHFEVQSSWPGWYVKQVDLFCPLGCAKAMEIVWAHDDDASRTFIEPWPTATFCERREETDSEGHTIVWTTTWAIWKISVMRVGNPTKVDVVWKKASLTRNSDENSAEGACEGKKRRL